MVSYFGMSGDQKLDPNVEVRDLIEEYRDRCLWFLRPDYVPSTPEEILQAIEYIERYGDRRAYQRAEEIRKWLLLATKQRS